MPGECQEIDIHRGYVQRIGAGTLSGIHAEEHPMPAGNCTYFGNRKEGAHHIGGMIQDNEPRVSPDSIFYFLRIEKTLL
ncbi:MAG: hypothetical protein DDT24_00818 [Chloroflexi bacterium]|nr:hypothetical protein [Chloroflexota bacterium]